jgi:hypothetical protein
MILDNQTLINNITDTQDLRNNWELTAQLYEMQIEAGKLCGRIDYNEIPSNLGGQSIDTKNWSSYELKELAALADAQIANWNFKLTQFRDGFIDSIQELKDANE